MCTPRICRKKKKYTVRHTIWRHAHILKWFACACGQKKQKSRTEFRLLLYNIWCVAGSSSSRSLCAYTNELIKMLLAFICIEQILCACCLIARGVAHLPSRKFSSSSGFHTVSFKVCACSLERWFFKCNKYRKKDIVNLWKNIPGFELDYQWNCEIENNKIVYYYKCL